MLKYQPHGMPKLETQLILYPLLKPLFLMVLLPDSMLPLPYPPPLPPAIQSLDTSVVKRLNEVKFSVAAVGTCQVILGHHAREATGPEARGGVLGTWSDPSDCFLVLEIEMMTAALAS